MIYRRLCTSDMWFLNFGIVFLALSFDYSFAERSSLKEFQVKLVSGFAPYAGQVFVYHAGTWGMVCSDGWDRNDALVVCKELGFPGVTMVANYGFFGIEKTISIEHMGCYGNETKLSECSYNTTSEWSPCRTGRYKGAGVICEPSNITDPKDVPQIRLTGPSHREGSGNVEVFINRQWGRICDDAWDLEDARVVCRALGFPDAEYATCCGWYFGQASGQPLMDTVECTGNESSLFHCRHMASSEASCSRRDSAGVICKLNKPNVRLVGSPLAHAGFVQIRQNGRWGSFCDWSWELTQGHVVCRELGYRRALYTTIGELFEQQFRGPIWVEEAVCDGNESSIFNCDLKYIWDYEDVMACDHSHSAGVICESNHDPRLNETALVRLKGSNFTHMGRVEIKRHGFWHAVCSIGFDIHDADVVCRQLGFSEAVLEVAHGQFGLGSGPMWLTSIRCQGNESSLDECVSAGWELEPSCRDKHSSGVVCRTPDITSDGKVRLRGSSSSNAGRIEVKFGGVWGLVSERGWDIRDGHVVCRQLGYLKAVRVYTHSRYGSVNLNIWLSDLQCSGEEKRLLDCPRELNYDLYTFAMLNAGVECTNDTNYTSEVEVRLVGMETPNAGHVQVKYNGTWGTICAWRGLLYQTAKVICRQLGHRPPIKNIFGNKECTATNRGAERVWLSSLNCQGFENSVDECPHRGWGRLDSEYCRGCTPRYCSVCLICQPQDTNITDLHLRLVGSNLWYAGRVEVKYAGVWGVICPRHMNGSVFRVICRQLGYVGVMGDESLYTRRSLQLYGDSEGPVWLSKVDCDGNETSLPQCKIESPGEILWCSHHEALEIMCQPKNYTPPYPIRLAGSSVAHAGRLEVLYNGTWGTVCGGVYDWSVRTANALVSCRQLGFGLPIRSTTSWLAPKFSNCPSSTHATGAIWLSNVRCKGTESSLDQCSSLGWGKAKKHCDHVSDVCLVCDNSQYHNMEIMVRLSGSEVPHAGRVKVRYQGVWGTLCASAWKTETAEVLCRQLGYKGVELDFTMHNKYWYLPLDIYDAVRGPVWFNGDGCNGRERTLSECQLRQEPHCGQDDPQLICKVENSSVDVFPVRLEGSNPREGRVEVFFGGLWGTVGSAKWDFKDALVLCRQLRFSHVQNTYTKKFRGSTRVFWFGDFECQGSEATLGQCRHRLIARAFFDDDEPFDVYVRCSNGTETETVVNSPRLTSLATSMASLTTHLPVLSTNTPRNSSSTASVAATTIYSTISSSTTATNTWKLAPTSTSIAQGSQLLSTPATESSPILCPNQPCQNGGTCEKTTCRCSEKFAGVYCEVYVGENAVSMVLKMILDQWNASEFKGTLAAVLTNHCSLNLCLEDNVNPDTQSQKKALTFQRDDIIILQGYPKTWKDMELLSVKLVVKMPTDANNSIIPREIMKQLLIKVAPEIEQQMGISIVFIGEKEIISASPDASGRNSDKSRKSSSTHRSVLIALAVVVGLVCLVAIATIAWYRRKKKRAEKMTLKRSDDEEKEENVRLVEL